MNNRKLMRDIFQNELPNPYDEDNLNFSASTFDELIRLLSNIIESHQLTLEEKTEISLLKLSILEIKNFGLEQSTILKKAFQDNLIKRNSRWVTLNEKLEKLCNYVADLKVDVNQFEIQTDIQFEKKMNYLNFLLKSANKSMTQESLKQFLLNCNSKSTDDDDELPYSIVMRDNHFKLKLIKNANYNLDGLTKLVKKVEKKLKNLNIVNDLDESKLDFSNDSNDLELSLNLSFSANTEIEELKQQLPDEKFAVKQLNKIISNINYLKWKSRKERLDAQKLFDQQQKQAVDDAQDQDQDESKPIIDENIHLNKTANGLDEFTDEIPDDFFAGLPCSQLAVDKLTKQNSTNNLVKRNDLNEIDETKKQEDEEDITLIGITEDEHQSINEFNKLLDQEIPYYKQSMLINENNSELDLSISSRNESNKKNSNEPKTNYIITNTSLNDGRFFTSSSESVIKRPKFSKPNYKATKTVTDASIEEENEDIEDPTESFHFKTSLSSQINFGK